MKGIVIIGIGFLFDAIPFLIGLVIFIIFAFPGSLAGALAGCVAGGSYFGEAGCKAGAAILGFLGTLANTEIALVTAPLGTILAIVVIDILNIVLGILMFTLLAFNGMFHLPYFFMGAIKIIPGFNIFPWWATIAYWSVKRKEKGGAAVKAHMKLSKEAEPKEMQGPPTPDGRRPIQPRYTQEPAPPTVQTGYKPQVAPSIISTPPKMPNSMDGVIAYKKPLRAANDTDRAAVERARYKGYKPEQAPPNRFAPESAPPSRFEQEPAPESRFKQEPAPSQPPSKYKQEPAPPKRNAA